MRNLAMVVAIGLSLVACKDKASSTGAGTLGKLTELKDKMCACKDAACAKAVSDEMIAWGKQQPTDKAAVDPKEQKRATEIGTQLGECMMRANGMNPSTPTATASTAGSGGAAPTSPPVEAGSGSATGSGSAVTALGASGLPKSCEDYKAAVDRLASCDKLSKQARETLAKGYTDAAAKWATMPESARDSLAVSCQGGTEAVMAVAKTQCGW
jgi:hypothetical protein